MPEGGFADMCKNNYRSVDGLRFRMHLDRGANTPVDVIGSYNQFYLSQHMHLTHICQICTQTHVYTHYYTYLYMQIRMHIQMNVYKHTHTNLYMHICTCS